MNDFVALREPTLEKGKERVEFLIGRMKEAPT